LGYSFSADPAKAFWVPRAVDPNLTLLKKLIKNRVIVFFNAVYDLAILDSHGVHIPIERVADVMIACFYRDVNEYKKNRGLKAQAKLLLYKETVELKEILMAILGKKKLEPDDFKFDLLSVDQQRVYACQDADVTWALWCLTSIQDAVAAAGDIWSLDHECIWPVIEMYRNGVGFDRAKNEEMGTRLKEACDVFTKQAYTMALKKCKTKVVDGVRIFEHEELQRLTKKKGLNLGSFVQKQILLFEVLKLPTTRKTKTGYSTDQDALTPLEHKHPLVPLILQYTKAKSRINSYTSKLPKLIHPVTSRIHSSLWLVGVKSGRFSCSNPNLQGISKDKSPDDVVHIREVFVAEDGNVLTAADYSQIELRVACSLADDTLTWGPVFAAGEDIHMATAREMYGVANPTAKQRDNAKTVNFSILTGIGPATLFARNRKTIESEAVAEQMIKDWMKAVPLVNDWRLRTMRSIVQFGYAETAFGRRRPFPEIRNPEESSVCQRMAYFLDHTPWAADMEEDRLRDVAIRSIQSSFQRKGLSHIIQGTAADIMKIALANMHYALKKHDELPIKMLLTVHDEVLFEHPAEITTQAHRLIRDTMNFDEIIPGWVPLPVDIGSGHSWAEAH
jgi:DNA polymerase-1